MACWLVKRVEGEFSKVESHRNGRISVHWHGGCGFWGPWWESRGKEERRNVHFGIQIRDHSFLNPFKLLLSSLLKAPIISTLPRLHRFIEDLR